MEFLQGNMHFAHRTRPGATTGYMNPRNLDIKGPMMGWGCSIGSDNQDQEEETARELDSVAIETASKLMQSGKRKVKTKK